MVRRVARDNVRPAAVRSGRCARHRPGSHRDTVALPFCHVVLRQERHLASYPCVCNTLGDHVRRRRLDLGLLQRQVAVQLGVNTSTVTNWELSHNSPDFRFLPAIIEFLGCDPRPEPETIGQTLIRHREGRGMSQKELAALLDVDPSTLGRWEQEERVPTGRFLRRIQEGLGAAQRLDR